MRRAALADRGPRSRGDESLATRLAVGPQRWWARQSLRARLTLVATALFTVAVVTGALLLLILQRYALIRVLDQAALKTARQTAAEVAEGTVPRHPLPSTGGIAGVQIVGANDSVLAASPGFDQGVSLIDPHELNQVRAGARLDITGDTSDSRLRVLGKPVGRVTVVVYTDVTRVDDSLVVLTRAALVGGPLAVLLMAFATYAVVALTLRSVAALRHGAADITAAGLSEQRLPVPRAQDEIHRLAVTLNAMLDRIDSATRRQRTFVGDAAHELRSPLASLRVQLEVGARLGPQADWSELVDDVLVDVDRLDRLVADLLALARLDEASGPARHQPLALDEVAAEVTNGYADARVPVRFVRDRTEAVVVDGDPDALRRVVINLVNNAARYAETGIDVTVRADGTDAVLTVQDDGPGIPEAEREQVFDRFYRVQQSRSRDSGGTGLGLAIVRDIVRGHGGHVRMASRPDGGQGLLVVVDLPLA